MKQILYLSLLLCLACNVSKPHHAASYEKPQYPEDFWNDESIAAYNVGIGKDDAAYHQLQGIVVCINQAQNMKTKMNHLLPQPPTELRNEVTFAFAKQAYENEWICQQLYEWYELPLKLQLELIKEHDERWWETILKAPPYIRSYIKEKDPVMMADYHFIYSWIDRRRQRKEMSDERLLEWVQMIEQDINEVNNRQ